jgi:hypothetical protein
MRSIGARQLDLDEIDALLDDLGCEHDESEDRHLGGEGSRWDKDGRASWCDLEPARADAARAMGATEAVDDGASVVRVTDACPYAIEPSELVGPVAVPEGYWLDGRQVLRYSADNGAVPGARLVTLGRRYRFQVADGRVWVPRWLGRRRDELGWVLDKDVGGVDGYVDTVGRAVDAVGVPRGLWDQVASVPYAVWAPELSADAMWDMAAVADALSVSVQTVSTYLSRQQMPAPQARAGRSPLWSSEIIWRWQVCRSGQGRVLERSRSFDHRRPW